MLSRFWNHPIWNHRATMPTLALVTVFALAAAAFAVFAVIPLDDQREKDRIASDLASCERGNRLRLQIVAAGDANADTLRQVLDVVLPLGRTERIDEIRAELEPVLAENQARLDDIQLTDCGDVVVGATSVPKGNP